MPTSSGHPPARPLLVVEDNDEDFQTLMWAFRRLGIETEVLRCADGDTTLDFLQRRGPFATSEEALDPVMILLDLNLPGSDGRDLLAELKKDDKLKLIPVVVWSSSENPQDIEVCYRSGANSYIVKPIHLNDLLSAVALLERYWLKVVALPLPGESQMADGAGLLDGARRDVPSHEVKGTRTDHP